MSIYSRTCLWLSMTSPLTDFWAWLLPVYGSGGLSGGSTRLLSDAHKPGRKSLLGAYRALVLSACRDNLVTLYYVPSALSIWRGQRTSGQLALISPLIWRLIVSPKLSPNPERLGASKRKVSLRATRVKLFTLDRANQSAFVGYIAIRHRIPGTNTYVLKLSARATSLRAFVRK